jgi:hypothetical protein
MDEDAVMVEVWRRMNAEAAGVRDASSKFTAPTAPASSSVTEAADRLQRSVAIVAERDRHKDRLVALAELWCHFRGGDPNELVTSLLADESPN